MESKLEYGTVKTGVPLLLESDMSTYRLFMMAHLMKYNESHLALTMDMPVVDQAVLGPLLG